MADDVSAGRLHLDAYADTSGFARDAKAKIEAATKDLRAKIKADLDTRGLAAQAKEAAKRAQEAATVRLKAEVDSRGLVAQIRRAASDASKQAAAKVKIGLQVDQAKFQRDLAAAVAAMNNRYSVSVNVDVDTAAADARMAAFRAGQRSLPINLGVNVNMGNLGQVLTKFAMFPALAGGVYLLVGAVAQLAGGLFAVVSSASQAVTTLAALPNLIGAIGMGIGVLVAGFSGIGEGIKALGETDAASAQQTAKAADIRTDSARAVADAQRALKDAYHQAADAARFSGYRVSDAEWSLARAQEAATEAQENLNEARKAARDRIDELNDSLERAALTEELAANNLAKAKAALQDVLFDDSATGQEKRDAQLAVQAAEQEVKDAKDRHEEVANAAAEANAEGVRGSEEVEQAREDLRDANHALMLAEREMFEARHAAADTQAQNARMIADAQRAIRDAQASGTQAIQAQNVAMAEQASAFDKLSPAAQRFARFLFDRVMPRFGQLRDTVQATLLPPIQKGIEAAMPFIDTLEDGLVDTADVVGDLAVRVGELFGSKGFNKDAASIMDSNNRALRLFGRAAFNIIKVLQDVAVVAGPTLLEPFAKWTVQLTRGWREAAKVGRETGTMEDRFNKARETAALLGSIIGNLWRTLRGLGRAATPVGDDLLQTFDRASERWANWANSDAGQERLTQFFEAIDEPFRRLMTLLGELSQTFVLLGETGGGPVADALSVLTGVFSGLNAILATPYLGTAVGWLLTLAGGAGALGMVAGVLVRMGGAFQLLAKISGITRLWNLFRMSLLGTRLGLIAISVQTKLAAAGMAIWNGVMTAATFLMGKLRIAASLMFGPWGIAIAVVIGLFILLYKKVDWFRAAVDWVMGKVVDAFNWVKDAAIGLWDELFGHSVFPDIVAGLQWFWGIVETIFGAVTDALSVLGKAFSWLWSNAVKPALGFVQRAISVVWNYYYKPILKLLWSAIKTAGAVMLWLWKNAVQPAWSGIQKIIRVAWAGIKVYFKALRLYVRVLGEVFKWLWKNIIAPAWKGIRSAIGTAWGLIKGYFRLLRAGVEAIGEVVSWLWKKAIVPAWNGIKTAINTVWVFVRDKVFAPLNKMVQTTIPNAFDAGVKSIKTFWDKLKSIAKTPVEFVVETVYNKGIRAVVNAIPGVDNLDEIHMATGGVLPGYTPGRDVHRFVSTDGKMGLNLSGGEGIIRPEAVRAMGPKAIDTINAAARAGGNALTNLLNPDTGGPGYADGGILGGVRKTMSYFLGGVLPLSGATQSSHGSAYPFPAYDLNYPGYADFGKPVVAWKAGEARAFDYGRDYSYGRGVVVNSGTNAAVYAHLSGIVKSVIGATVRAGQTIGAVGDYGNTGDPATSHLHFEARGGGWPNLPYTTGPSGSSAPGGKSAAEVKGEKEKDGWMDAVGAIKDTITSFPGYISTLSDKGGWGPMMVGAVKNLGGQLRQWINDKIPNSIEIPGPNIPLPDNPIPSLFDRGGDWTGGLGLNASGKTETVFTNENIVDLTGDLARISQGLRAQTVDRANGDGGGTGLRIDKLELSAAPGDVPKVLGDLTHTLRLLSLGGVHAKRLAGASV